MTSDYALVPNSEKKEKEKRHKHAILHEDELSEDSSFSLVFLAATFHDDPKKLRAIFEEQYYNLCFKINKIDAKDRTDNIKEQFQESFDSEIRKVNLEEVEDHDEKEAMDFAGDDNIQMQDDKILVLDTKQSTARHPKQKENIFLSVLLVAILSLTIQLSFIITIIKEYFHEPLVITNDPELITIRLLAFVTVTLKVWIELTNGKSILNHGVFHGYLYRDLPKRTLSCLMGFFEMFSAWCTYYCVAMLIIRTQTVIECVKDFGALIIITEIDNWIGEYFLKTKKAVKIYTRDYICQISVIIPTELFRYNWLSGIEDAISLTTLILVIIPIYHSISFFN